MAYGAEEHVPNSPLSYEAMFTDLVSEGQGIIRLYFFGGPVPDEGQKDAFFQKILTAISTAEDCQLVPDNTFKYGTYQVPVTP